MTENGQNQQDSSTQGSPDIDITQFPELVQDWMEYTSSFPTTQRFNLWCCLAAIGGAIQRRSWVVTAGRPLFPNTFILLISPPGIGKSDAIRTVRDIWRQFVNLPVAPQSMTGKGIVDQLASDNTQQTLTLDGEKYTFSSLLIPAAELGTLIQEYDLTQISIMNELYDCNENYAERTRGGGFLEIERPHISMIMGTQPKYLSYVFPEAAFGMGLTSRIIMIYDDAATELDLFGTEGPSQELFKKLVDHFRPIASMKGPFSVSDEAKKFIQQQHHEGIPPKPDSVKLAHYNTRRTSHMLKLSMIFGAARHRKPAIEVEDVQNAITVMLEAETRMEDVFADMSKTSEGDLITETYNHLIKLYNNNSRNPVKEQNLHSFLQQRVPAWKIDYILSTLVKSGAMKREAHGPHTPPDMVTVRPGEIE